VLQEVDVQYPLQPNRWMAIPRFGIEWLNPLTELIPRHHLVYLSQKMLPARWLAVALKISSGEGLLHHR